MRRAMPFHPIQDPDLAMNKSKLLLALSLLATAVPGAAETLAEAWTAAVASHRQIAAASANRDAAGFELDEARGARLPQLGLASAYTQFDTAPGFAIGPLSTGPVFAGDDYLSAGAQLSLPLYSGGAIRSGVEAAEFGAKAAEGHLGTVIQDIKLGVAEHYVAVLRAESSVDVAESYVASLRSHTEDTRNRWEFGDVPQNEYLAASVTLADAEQRLLQARNGLDYARSAYNRLLGRELDAPVALDPVLAIDDLLPASNGLADLIALATSGRQELATLENQSNALRRQSDAARAGARPQLALTGGYMYLENDFLTDDEFWMAGVSFQWNLFDGGQSRKRSAALDRKATAISHQRADFESLVALQVRRAWSDRGEAESRLAVAESAVTQATENLRVVRNRYQAGASTNVEVLDAEALREQSLSNRHNARYELALAQLRLARAVGEL